MALAQWRIATAAAVVAVTMVVINAVLFVGNREVQIDLNARAQFVQQSMQLEGLFNEMVRALAELAVRNDDAQLKALLHDAGVTYTVTPAVPAGQAK